MWFVEGRARPAVSVEMCLFWEYCACSLAGSTGFLRSQTENKMDITWYGFTLRFLRQRLASPSLPRSPLSPPSFPRPYSNNPMQNPFVLCTQIFQFELDTPHATHPRSYAKPFPPDPRHTYAVLFCGSFLRTLFLLRVARANVSRCTCDVLLTHDRRASPTHVAYSGMLPLSRLKFLKLLCPSLDLRLTLS